MLSGLVVEVFLDRFAQRASALAEPSAPAQLLGLERSRIAIWPEPPNKAWLPANRARTCSPIGCS